MAGWKDWVGKQVFIVVKSGHPYSGTVVEVEDNSPLIWITILDKFNKRVTFVNSEILTIKEEGR